MKSSLGMLALTHTLTIAVAVIVLARGLRGLRSPRIWGMLLAIALGGILMLKYGQSWRAGKLGIPLTTTNASLFLLGATLSIGVAVIGLGSVFRLFRALHMAMDRLDGYLQGSAPLPFPEHDATARRDLDTVARLLKDPVQSHRYPPEVHHRVAALAARPLPAPRG